MARRQTNGRGRQGRPWIDPLGNFAASLCFVESLPTSQASLRSFAAAIALMETLGRITNQPQSFALKWPNDVLLNGGKLAGILLESSGHGQQVDRLCIGVGVNLIAAPKPEDLPDGALKAVSLLAQTGTRLEPEDLLDQLAPALDHWDQRLRTEGFEPIKQAWLAAAARLGEDVEVFDGKRTLTGTFETISDDGSLVVRDGLMRHRIQSGDVRFPS